MEAVFGFLIEILFQIVFQILLFRFGALIRWWSLGLVRPYKYYLSMKYENNAWNIWVGLFVPTMLLVLIFYIVEALKA